MLAPNQKFLGVLEQAPASWFASRGWSITVVGVWEVHLSKLRSIGSWVVLAGTLMGCRGRSTDGNDTDPGVATVGADPSASSGGMLGSGGSGESDGNGGATLATGGAASVGGQSTTGGAPTDAGGAPSMGGQSANGETDSGSGGSGGTGGSGGAEGGTGGERPDEELCEWGSYDTDQTDDELTCEAWTECQPGEYLADHGGFWDDNLCEPCSHGTFSQSLNERHCKEWHKCKLGEQIAVEPSRVSDRSCEASELFPPYSGNALGVVLPSEGPQLLVTQEYYPDSSEVFVVSYSLSGQSRGEVTVANGVEDHVLDFISVGEEAFVVGGTPSGDGSPAFVRKVSETGTIAWETRLGSGTDHFNTVRVAGAGDIYVVAEVYEAGEGPARIHLYVVDPADGSLSTVTLQGNPIGSPHDVEVAANGHIYVAGLASAGSSASTSATIMEFDAAGSLIAEQAVSESDWLAQLASDQSGGVYALGAQWPQRLYHLNTGGELLSTVDLGTGDWQMEAMTSTPEGVLVVGRTPQHPALVTTDPNGEVTVVEVLEDIEAPQSFVGIERASDGTLFVAGTNVSLGRVYPVAFVAPWPD